MFQYKRIPKSIRTRFSSNIILSKLIRWVLSYDPNPNLQISLIFNKIQQLVGQMQQRMNQPNQPQFSVEKALQFVGDNSTYQKKRLLVICVVILTFAMLTCRLPLMNPNLNLAFLFASGLGQIFCPIYYSLKTISQLLLLTAVYGVITYPLSEFGFDICLLAMGFFGRGYFVSALIYLTEIGGDKFRSWSIIVVFAIWGLSSFVLSLERILHLSQTLWVYFMIILPFIVGSILSTKFIDLSPLKLYTKRNFSQAKIILNKMAIQNKRPQLPYSLQGQNQTDTFKTITSKQHNYMTLIANPVLKQITIPLLVLWIYRQYIYYGTYMLVPELGKQISKNLILLSVSEIVAVLMAYPIKLRVKRVNAFFGFTTIIGICCLFSSFTIVDQDCMEGGSFCITKYIYRFSIMLIRFSISLIANILINYTLQIYPSNVRSLGFAFCIGASSLGSTVLPWLIQSFIYVDLSGFIGFTIATLITLYFINNLQQTSGKMKAQNLEEIQKNIPMISLENWATLNFE